MQCNRLEAQDWMQFRGAGGSAGSADANLPVKWDTNTNIKWKKELPGPGASSPIIVGDKVILTCYSGYGDKSKGVIEDLKRHLLCFDRSIVCPQRTAKTNERSRHKHPHGIASGRLPIPRNYFPIRYQNANPRNGVNPTEMIQPKKSPCEANRKGLIVFIVIV